jgi:transposase, IS6 family
VRWHWAGTCVLHCRYRDVEELLAELGLPVDHVTGSNVIPGNSASIAIATAPRRPTTAGGWTRPTSESRAHGCIYLYRVVDSSGVTIELLLSAKRDAAASGRFLGKALGRENHPAPRVINTDEHARYPPAIVRLKSVGALQENCRHRPVQYFNNVLEQDHRAFKRRVRVSQHFSFVLGSLAYDRRLRGDPYDPQTSRVLACGWCERRSTAMLHSRSFSGDELNSPSYTRHSARLHTCNTFLKKAFFRIFATFRRYIPLYYTEARDRILDILPLIRIIGQTSHSYLTH